MSKFVVQCSWDEVPHLTAEARRELWDSIPEYQRKARTEGIPELGAGAVWSIPIDDISVDGFPISEDWKQCYALDVGWRWTAAVWAATDPVTDVTYLTGNYKRGQAEPAIHAAAIRERGDWIPGVCDPAAQTANQVDGRKLLNLYRQQHLNLEAADHAVEAGIFDVWNRLATGKLKVFKHLAEWFAEFRMYRRGENGRIVKEHDHLMDATRYLVVSGLKRATVKPRLTEPKIVNYEVGYGGSGYDRSLGWMQ